MVDKVNHPDLLTRTPSPDAGAIFSECLRYRYHLWRQWRELTASAGFVLWLMLNPSSATELVLDPTLTRCKGFTQRFGFSRFEVVNLYALRSTDPKALLAEPDPVGPSNDLVIRACMEKATVIVVGWGAFPMAANRARRVVELAEGKQLHCLGTTKDGHPRHPLYLPGSAELRPWAIQKAA